MGQYKTLNNFANEFSSSTSYAVGDLVMYLGELYQCTTAHNGAWNSADFTKTSVATQLANAGGGSSGGTQLYLHKVTVTNSTSSTSYTYLFLSNTATPMTFEPSQSQPYFEGNVNDFASDGSKTYLASPIFRPDNAYSIFIAYGYWIINRLIVDNNNNAVIKNDVQTWQISATDTLTDVVTPL